MKKLGRLEKNTDSWFLIITFFIFFLLRLPSLFEPLWYGDEGIYQAIGIAINNGKLLYQDIFDNKPPLLYLIYAIFNSDQFLVRLISLIFGLFTCFFFFLLSKKFFQKNISYLVTSIFIVLFAIPLLEGNIANAENFMLLPILISAFLIFRSTTSKLLISGLFLGIAFLFKIVAVFDFLAFSTFIIILNFANFKNIKNDLKHLRFFIIGFFFPLVLVSIFFIFKGAFNDFFKAVFLTNISYVNYGNAIKGLPIFLFIKGFILLSIIIFIFTKRKIFSKKIIFISIWIAFSVFNAFFSQRPYIHYVLVVLPSFCLLIGLILSEKKYRKLIIFSSVALLLILFKNFNFNGINKSISYYSNFISFLKGEKTMVSYAAFFDRNTPRDYEIARFIKPKIDKGDTIFIWGNNAQVYSLTKTIPSTKYIVAYHMTNYRDGIFRTQKELEKTKPKFIVVMPNERPIPFLLLNYSQKIIIENVVIYERTI